MVNITVYMEGGVLPANNDAATAARSESLRRSLYYLFRSMLGREVSIQIEMKGGYEVAVNHFVKDHRQGLYLFADLDAPREEIKLWLHNRDMDILEVYLKSHHAELYKEWIGIKKASPLSLADWMKSERGIAIPEGAVKMLSDYSDSVFLMIQKMEAWILKDSAAIERWAHERGYQRRHEQESVQGYIEAKNPDVEMISDPDVVLKNLIQHFYVEHKNGKQKKVKYHKLTPADELLLQINPKIFLSRDAELQRFCHTVMQ